MGDYIVNTWNDFVASFKASPKIYIVYGVACFVGGAVLF